MKKRSKKLLCSSRCSPQAYIKKQKFFGSFFQKRTFFLIMLSRFTRLATLVIALAIPLWCNPAWADFNWPFIQLTCAPDLHYFALRTARMDDIQPANGDAARRLQLQAGIYGLDDIVAHDQTCDLGNGTTITVKAAVFQHNAFNCQTWELGDYTVVVKSHFVPKGIKSLVVSAGTCDDASSNVLEIDQFGIRQCSFPGSEIYPSAAAACGDPTKP